jgi:hypothetical protein
MDALHAAAAAANGLDAGEFRPLLQWPPDHGK